MFERFSRKTIAATGAAFLAALGVSGAAVAANGQPSQSKEVPGVESNAPENSATDKDNVQYTAPGDADYKGTSAKATSSTAPIASRSTTPEAPGTEQAPGSETPGEQPGSEAPGNDGPGGHADEANGGNANADHQFQGAE